ncbi:AspT/YidE/YbjL antiporter-like protein [Dysgonomonas sp. PFB1-18]|uniref:putative transporter n=1 Tax=unclassified Dysgonomonas TaxID=2630389 RepID=UPI0024764C9E|nr:MULTISPECIES: putative transporter [unclassified Dysgonomonas]MDH6309357.1 AspT/YidE/YbjL antiporter-like protein [Dysgonomonas sp. PF1-14]MDH6339778.1 AspT/YidE/YbjL antiporter-like protein [Dysgonomonas sp. PF1-16]MDH6381426.1 AspT/YidE/YbjL antiporter-like protein [Dysgonomonas sp. PFB1-18]MDH6398641.1 AspT/YidE/YbjL antiporter-like protein [Dysgonomonas sp. PF1-23]
MDWLTETILEPSSVQTIIIISIVSAIGILLGKLKLFNISLGITFVFFVGILFGHINLDINRDMLSFAQNFGLILFVYALGLQVGPGFFSSLKKGGLQLNMMALGVIFIGLILTVILSYASNISLPNMVGILCGATTNTPALGAAQQALKQITGGDMKAVADMALATAVAYPLGVIGVILAIIFLRKFFVPKDTLTKSHEKKDNNMHVGEFHITNPAVEGKSIRDIMQLTSKHFVISRIWHDGVVTIPTSESILRHNDHLLIISKKSDVEHIKVLFGEQENVDWNKEDIDWNHIDNSQLVSRRLIVTNSKVNGVKLGTLKLRNNYGINITRVNRAGIDLLASPDLSLQIGDRLTVVGEKASIDNVAKIIGDEIKRLDKPNLIAIFLGIALGLILGALPLPFPGMTFPVKLGIAGGPIIVGILMGAFGPRFHITTYTTQSANLLMREFGLTVYLACLGIGAGEHFFETVFQTEGLIWIAFGFILTVVPVLIVALIAMKVFHLEYSKNVGMLCGSMANPMALNYVDSIIDDDEPSVAYATVYPVSMFTRIVFTQLLLMLFI